jgi:hypothetical protein
VAWGATAGFLAGFSRVTLGIGIVALFERRPWAYLLVNGGYMVVAFVVMGAILGAWGGSAPPAWSRARRR